MDFGYGVEEWVLAFLFFFFLDCNSNALQKCVNIGIYGKIGWEIGLYIACLLRKCGLSVLFFI
jgi:hypothetical protein